MKPTHKTALLVLISFVVLANMAMWFLGRIAINLFVALAVFSLMIYIWIFE